MLTQTISTLPATRAALVTRACTVGSSIDEYLQLSEDGSQHWVLDPGAATPFPSMRDTTRMAMRLPAALRAFSLPRDVELTLSRPH